MFNDDTIASRIECIVWNEWNLCLFSCYLLEKKQKKEKNKAYEKF